MTFSLAGRWFFLQWWHWNSWHAWWPCSFSDELGRAFSWHLSAVRIYYICAKGALTCQRTKLLINCNILWDFTFSSLYLYLNWVVIFIWPELAYMIPPPLRACLVQKSLGIPWANSRELKKIHVWFAKVWGFGPTKILGSEVLGQTLAYRICKSS